MQGFLTTEPAGVRRGTLLLAHGAGVAMDSPFMNRFAGHAAAAGLVVARFEFAYMAARRDGGKKRPPPAAEKLVAEYVAALDRLLATCEGPVLIGGKSLGGRVAAMVGGREDLSPRVAGVVCLGYPFHPTDDPAALRLAPLENLRVPALIAQGERDPFGDRREVEALRLPERVRLFWCEDGSHDLAPRGAAAATWDGNLKTAAAAAAALLD
jgi:predicted alpha/beta-hydrolase family hydrolase